MTNGKVAHNGSLESKNTSKIDAPPSTITISRGLYGFLTTIYHSSSHIMGKFLSSVIGMGQQSRNLPAAGNNTIFNYNTGHN